ncbi:RND superfamily putative drug exporter [Nocardia caishijiensis]|uniref:RND superfamily putative drug exporter n=1 Tax=Nocardia caishijiensis TaxID=184756 RepID=A0ABQ6YUV2_9NOCA|nr:RND superfamily putative drug exporter [Nocardia caishijiensis]
MFTRWGDLVYRFRFAVIGVVGAALLALGGFGFGLEDHLSSSGLDDPNSESSQAARISDGAWGRNHDSDIVVMYNAPEGKTIDDPEFSQKIVENLAGLTAKYPDSIDSIVGAYWRIDGKVPTVPSTFGSKDKKHAFTAIRLKGSNDTETLRSYRATKGAFEVPGVDTEVSGLQGMAGTLNDTMAHDTKRMELLAIPAVGVLLFFIFGGIVAAALPLIIGGLTVIGANGIIMALTHFTEVNSFVSGVVSMIGLGLAIDYGLFIVSRFREELAEGYDTHAAVRRSVMTAGRTVVFSATMIVASLGGILLFPQGFLRSIAYGTIATVSLAALTAITILPAMLAILGPRVDMLGLKWFRKDKTADEIENGFWGNLTRWVMKHPLKIAIPITIGLLLLIIPVKDLAFGGINEKYLPPDNETRLALEHFYEVFPMKKTDPIEIVFVGEDTNAIGAAWKAANQAPGLVGPFGVPSTAPTDKTIYRTSATLVSSDDADQTIDYLRAIETPDNVQMYVGGQPAIMKDSIDALLNRMPLMIALVLLVTTILMFLTFGSLVLPIKAAVMSALGLGSTLGILTWIFIDGHGSGILNFTPQPISAPVLVLIIAIIYGLSTDYEVFLLSRMVEARAQGASTTEAVRIGTAQTGRIITAAALILLVVTGAFAFSDLVMMQYIAYGMIAALFIDATILRMLLVPAIMKLLGDDCWWAPKWMKRIQEKIGLGEPILDDERPDKGAVVDLVKTTPITDPPTMQMVSVPDAKLAKTPRRPRTVAEIEAEAPTQRIDKVTESAEPARPRLPMSPDPTRPRASMLSGEPTRVLPVVQPGGAKPADADDQPTQMLPAVKPNSPAPDAGSGAGSHANGRGAGADAAPVDPATGRRPVLPDSSAPGSAPGGPRRGEGTSEPGADGVIGTAPAVDGVNGGLDLPDVRSSEPAPRGSERVQPPAGYGPSTPRVSTPGSPVGGETPRDAAESRPSIVTPARPRRVDTPPATTPPSIVNPPTPRPGSRGSDFPASGTFNGFTPLPRNGVDDSANISDDAPNTDRSSQQASEDVARESNSQGFMPPQADLTATPGAHRADAQPAAEPVSDLPEFPDLPMRRPAPEERDAQPENPAQNVFGTPVPVEPQTSWTDGGAEGAPTTEAAEPPMSAGASSMWASIDSARRSAQLGAADNAQPNPVDRASSAREQGAAQSDPVRTPNVGPQQVAPPGFTPVPAPESARPGPGTPAEEPETAPFTAGAHLPGEGDAADADQGVPGVHPNGENAGGWQAPPGFTPIPNSDAAVAPSPSAPVSENGSAATTEDDPQAETRTEIENWMAQLRSSRRGSDPVDEGRHHGDDERTVSVNELLRRRNDETS